MALYYYSVGYMVSKPVALILVPDMGGAGIALTPVILNDAHNAILTDFCAWFHRHQAEFDRETLQRLAESPFKDTLDFGQPQVAEANDTLKIFDALRTATFG